MLGGFIGTVFLIIDLGRPERFLNMLRVFRPTSPLNLGSWILASDVPLMTGSVLLGDSALGNLSGDAAAVLGLPLAGYTAVLLSNTAVPAWQNARKSLPALFMASAVSSAAGLLETTALSDHEHKVVRRFGIFGKTAELCAAFALEKEVGGVESVARTYKEGLGGSLWSAAKSLTAASLVVSVLPGKSRKKGFVTGMLATAGALAVRFAVYHAGKAATRDPKATFDTQRA
jgi:formate-dependent nitrite reductase membrane component NrfD